MSESPHIGSEYTVENPPGDMWVCLRSGSSEPSTHKGKMFPKRWANGRIFVKDGRTNEWFYFDRERGKFDQVLQNNRQWADWAEDVWVNDHLPIRTRIRRTIASLFADKDKKVNFIDRENHLDWSGFFKQRNAHNKSRSEVFPDGAQNMSETEIVDYLQKNFSFMLAGGADPLEFPELIDQELRPICNSLNQTSWARSSDSCSGHPLGEKGHSYTGYDNPYLRVFLDVNDKNADRFIENAVSLAKEWETKYTNIKINLDKEAVISQKKKPRIIRYYIAFKIEPPAGTEKNSYIGSEECHQISSSFFDALNQSIATMQN